MIALQMVLVVLSLLVLGAHFLRAGALPVVAAVILLIVLLFVRRPWTARVVQVVLVLGTLEWLRTLYNLVSARIEVGQPFVRLAAIMGAVAAVTLLAALALQKGALGRAYGLGNDSDS